MATEFNDTLKRGDTGVWDVAFLNNTGGPLDLTGAVVRMTAKRQKSDADSSAVLRKDSAGIGGFVVTDAGGGLATVTVPPADTSGLTQDVWLAWDFQVTEQGGAVTTVREGVLKVLLDVTQAA